MSREMVNSGIPWIGDIPKEWKINRLKNLATDKDSLIIDGDWIESSVIELSGIRYLTTGNIGDGVFKEQGQGCISEETFNLLNCTMVYAGDLVFSRLNYPIGRSCIIPKTYERCVVAVDNVIFRPNNDISRKFLMYVSMCTGFQNENALIARGTTMQRMSRTQLIKVSIPQPSLSEQQRIASFLDKKCAEVDEMIVLQEKIIEELKAYKQSVITEAVTKGLNPNVPMKESGIEWIGQIPVHWEVCRLKNVLRLKTGTTPNGYDVIADGDRISWFTPSDISDECNELYSSERTLLKSVIKEVELFPVGSIMFVGIGASAGKLGYAQIEGYSNQQITALIPSSVNGKFFYYFLIADKKRLKDNAFFTTLPIINNGYLSQNKVLCPPSSIQNEVVHYLDTKCTEIDNLISIKQQKIEHLKEYKKSIIYEYVTGKKEVE